MTLSDMTRIGVLGAGQMGRGIAQVSAASGWDVWLFDTKPEALEVALGRIRQGLNRAVEKGTVKADQKDAIRSEERRVGKECRGRCAAGGGEKKSRRERDE